MSGTQDIAFTYGFSKAKNEKMHLYIHTNVNQKKIGVVIIISKEWSLREKILLEEKHIS